jgi:hypothetical protein
MPAMVVHRETLVEAPSRGGHLPSVARINRPIASFTRNGRIWEIAWHGVWVECAAGLAPPAARFNFRSGVPFAWPPKTPSGG